MTSDCSHDDRRGDVAARLSEIHNALADRQRRYALYHLRDCGSASLEAVAEQVADWERERDGADPTAAQVRALLHHVHLPALDDAALVEYDPRANDVAYREAPAALELLLDASASLETPPSGA